MDPMSALAVAAAVIQFAEFGRKLLVKSRDKLMGPIGVAQDLPALNEQLSALSTALHDAAADPNTDCTSTHYTRLEQLCRKCDHLAAEIQSILDENASQSQSLTYWGRPHHRDPNSSVEVRATKAKEQLQAFRKSVMETLLLCIW